MRITENKYYQINKNINSKKNYTSIPTFKMGINKSLQAVDGLENTAKKAGFWTKIKSFLAGSFFAGLFGLSINNDTENNTDKTEEINNENITNNGKIQSEKIFEIEDFLDNSMLLEEFFKLNPNIDINSKNKNGDTLVLKAIRERHYHILDKLQQREKDGIISGVDWNAVDADGKNGLMIAIEQRYSEDIQYLNEIDYDYRRIYMKSYYKKRNDKNCVCDINSLLELGISPNYINNKTKFQRIYCTPLQELIILNNKPAIEAILEFKNTDVNISHPDTPPPLFMLNESFYGDSGLFERMAKHPSCNLHKKYKGQNICEYLSQPDRSFMTQKDMIRIVERILTKESCNNLKKYYQASGELNLDQIYEYIQLPQLYDVIDKPLNDLKQNIAHFAAGVHTDGYEQLRKMNTIIKQILKNKYSILEKKDVLSRSSFDIACEAENYNFLKLLLSGADSYELLSLRFELMKSLKKLPEEQLNEVLPFVKEIYKKNDLSFDM